MDAATFKSLYLPYHKKLFRIAFHLLENGADAEDVVQETYAKLWEKRDELPLMQNPASFCVVMVKNRCMDVLRSAQHQVVSFDPVKHERPTQETPLESLENKYTLDLVQQLMEGLPATQQLVMKLRHMDECSMEEIEQITGLTAVNIRVLLSRARKTIREQFNAHHHYEYNCL